MPEFSNIPPLSVRTTYLKASVDLIYLYRTQRDVLLAGVDRFEMAVMEQLKQHILTGFEVLDTGKWKIKQLKSAEFFKANISRDDDPIETLREIVVSVTS